MSLSMFVFLVLACDNPAVLAGNFRLKTGKETLCVGYADRPNTAIHHLEGELISVNQDGVVIKRGDQWLFYFLAEETLKPLKSPKVATLRSSLFKLKGPAFYNQEHLYLWENDTWHSYDLDVFVESKPPKSVPGSQYGLNFIYPQIMESPNRNFFMYQQKNGVLNLWERQTLAVSDDHFGREGRAFRIGNRIAWSGVPEKSKVSLGAEEYASQLLDDVEISHLNKHSIITPVSMGTWVLTFPSGIRDGLKSWDSGTLPMKGYFLSLEGRESLKTTKHTLPKLPLKFELTTSSSGSPRLNVTPQFQVFGVGESDTLVILSEGKIHRVDAISGLNTQTWPAERPIPLSFVRKGRDLGGYDSAGEWQIYLKGWF